MSVTRIPICGIYRITNLINGKCYIGQSRDIKKRWIDHRRKSPHLSNIYLHRAIRKYGIDKFYFEIVEECSVEKLNNLERQHIILCDSRKPSGYNLDLGGGAGKETSEETRAKIRRATLGENNPNYGKSKSESTRRKLALSHSPSVNQYAMNGRYLRTFQTTVEAVEALGLGNNYGDRHKICRCCNGERGASLGFQWRYASIENADIKLYREHIGNSVSVSKYKLNGEYIATYQSAQEAGESVNRSNACILFACNHNGTSGGYTWRRTV